MFALDDQHFTLPASVTREAFVPTNLTPLPGSRGALLGLTRARGRAVPLLDLLALSGQASGGGLPGLALLIELQTDLLALPAHEVIGLLSLEPLPDESGLFSRPFPVGERSVRHLHPAALLSAVRTRLHLT